MCSCCTGHKCQNECIDLRSSILRAKASSVLVGWGVHAVAVLDLISQIFVDGAGLIVDFDLPKAWNAKEEVLVVYETLILWQGLVVVPHLPIHAIEKGSLCELQA